MKGKEDVVKDASSLEEVLEIRKERCKLDQLN